MARLVKGSGRESENHFTPSTSRTWERWRPRIGWKRRKHLRVHSRPGYRVYYKQTGKTIIVVLCGGDKSTQDKDIKRAKEVAVEL
jgi:hypothetical protein